MAREEADGSAKFSVQSTLVSAAYEQKLHDEVKALDGFKITLFAGPPFAEYPTCIAALRAGWRMCAIRDLQSAD